MIYGFSKSGVPPNSLLFGGTVPPNSVLFGKTVPPNSFLTNICFLHISKVRWICPLLVKNNVDGAISVGQVSFYSSTDVI